MRSAEASESLNRPANDPRKSSATKRISNGRDIHAVGHAVPGGSSNLSEYVGTVVDALCARPIRGLLPCVGRCSNLPDFLE